MAHSPQEAADPQAVRALEQMLQRGQAGPAERAALDLVARQPGCMEAWVLLGHARRQRGDLDGALHAAQEAESLAPGHPAPGMLRADLLLAQGHAGDGLQVLDLMAARGDALPVTVLQDLAQRYTQLGRHAQALACHETCVAREPEHPAILYNLSTSLIALGRMDEAEAVLDRVIERAPTDADAWYNRATLRRQTPERNHVAALQARLSRPDRRPQETVALNYALAKELEDLGRHEQCFQALRRGADARRAGLAYRVQDDEETLAAIARHFDADFFARPAAGNADARPVFVVGLPRSGTTLVDRIISSHPAVHSRGETSDLAMALMRGTGPATDKQSRVRQAAAMDLDAFGRDYLSQLPQASAAREVDKTPINFLYLGLVARALPGARIVHVRRHPMDACYAMYKTLFRMAYPFSYDLDDLGRYWLAYDRLMAHWRRWLPAHCLHELHYEGLVARQESTSRALIEFLGLQWDPACLAPERNPEPSLTASAAQIRQPVYSSSVGAWRRHAQALAPLQSRFSAAGVDVDARPWERA
ncbi:tetratricopeptide repeat-containing sulfotransferase family protein [Arenimonas donghaensis]|uniref:Uncharacterized protein n=1 Tax=Arenimonas donghaensis DSM 18148 = HO3-R19 TaxID=1121014 RepID=A0A087MKX5_9GAMM|nr:sulfotransferase [Arenimonas donghaensis]KFL37528.1 hypothetical protein N788_09075 [Arenimonas donghaensis DSM 18148 = HO3-R19]